jgi:large subunit ribosomal protein L27
MATRKAAGSAKNLTDSNPQYLGLKKGAGENVISGNIIVRQRGTKYIAGKGTGLGKDDTIFALKDGKVVFSNKRQVKFDNRQISKKVVNVI